ncbi:MAG: ABC transporter ATP-binding protein [Bacteroidota bacterium]
MLKNLQYVFRFDRRAVRQSILWEWLHSIFLAAPSAILLLVIWELFEPQPNFQKIWIIIGIMVGLFFIQLYVAKRAMFASNYVTFEISRKLRLALGNKLQRLSLGYYKKRDPGDLAAVALQDVANFENIFGHAVPNLANLLFGTAAISIFLMLLDWRLGLTLIAALFLILPFTRWCQRLVASRGVPQIAARNATGARFLEYVQGIRPIKAFRMTGTRFQSLDKALNTLRKESIRVEAGAAPVVLAAGAILELGFLVMVWVALYFLSGGSLTVPVLIGFLLMGYRLYEPAKILMAEYALLSYMNVSLNRITEVLEAPEQSGDVQQLPSSYDVQFQNVSFSYVGTDTALSEVSFLAPQGSLTALVGPSGSGKTTITALLSRFWDISSGTIRIGGVPLSSMAPATVYSLISQVFQEVYLFDGSIYENIALGKPTATEEEVMQAAKAAQVLEFATDLPQGLQTLVGEGGSKLSGGQKQRISIARALLKDAPIVLLDEATASLDPENELYIQQAIEALVKDKTVIVIAHKLATIRQADQILVLNHGCLVERGRHEELLSQAGQYARLWHTQQKISGWKFTGKPTTEKEHPTSLSMNQ